MTPAYVKHITVSQNEDGTYNIVYIADLLDGEQLYEDCEIVMPRAAILDDNIVLFPYYSDEGESLITLVIPEDI